jgi:hypothetical protein
MRIMYQTTWRHSPVLIFIHSYLTTLWVGQTAQGGEKIPWHWGQKCLISSYDFSATLYIVEITLFMVWKKDNVASYKKQYQNFPGGTEENQQK